MAKSHEDLPIVAVCNGVAAVCRAFWAAVRDAVAEDRAGSDGRRAAQAAEAMTADGPSLTDPEAISRWVEETMRGWPTIDLEDLKDTDHDTDVTAGTAPSLAACGPADNVIHLVSHMRGQTGDQVSDRAAASE